MPKILSILTLVFALGVAVLGFLSKGNVEKIQAAAEQAHGDLVTAKNDAKVAKDKQKAAEEELATTKGDLEKSKEALEAAQTAATKAQGELDGVKKQLETANAEIAKIKGSMTPQPTGNPDLEAKVAELTAKAGDLEKEKAELTTTVETLTVKSKELEGQKKDFDEQLASKQKVIDRYQQGIMSKGVRGRVLAVNAGWGFCVISIGDRQGAVAGKTLVVVRGGQSIGRVKISNVETSQSVADIIPSSFVRGTYVQPGDDVVFLGDEKRVEAPADGAVAGGATSPELPKQ